VSGALVLVLRLIARADRPLPLFLVVVELGVLPGPAVRLALVGSLLVVDDLRALAAAGVAGAVSGRALLEGRMQPEELAPFLRNE